MKQWRRHFNSWLYNVRNSNLKIKLFLKTRGTSYRANWLGPKRIKQRTLGVNKDFRSTFVFIWLNSIFLHYHIQSSKEYNEDSETKQTGNVNGYR